MKKTLLLAWFFCAFAMGADTKVEAKKDDKFVNVFDGNGKIVAEVNTTTGKVKHFDTAEKSFEVIFGAMMKYAQDCPCAAEKCKQLEKKDSKETKKK